MELFAGVNIGSSQYGFGWLGAIVVVLVVLTTFHLHTETFTHDPTMGSLVAKKRTHFQPRKSQSFPYTPPESKLEFVYSALGNNRFQARAKALHSSP